jgi:Uma2 family endonuclease
MSPVKVYHSAFQGKIARLLPDTGIVLSECAIKTANGTKVADVAWASTQRFVTIRPEAECSIAPEICVEVISQSNSKAEIKAKSSLYFAAGAVEFWVCNEKGEVKFFDSNGIQTKSALAPEFPDKIIL